MGVGKFPDHFAQDIGQVVPVGQVRQQWSIALAFLFPVHAVHGSFEEIITLLPPHLVENLVPLGLRIDFHAHGSQIQRAFAGFMGFLFRLGVDNTEGLRPRHAFVSSAAAGPAGRGVEDLLAVKGERVVGGRSD